MDMISHLPVLLALYINYGETGHHLLKLMYTFSVELQISEKTFVC